MLELDQHGVVAARGELSPVRSRSLVFLEGRVVHAAEGCREREADEEELQEQAARRDCHGECVRVAMACVATCETPESAASPRDFIAGE